jgi:hypothetical protein
VGYGSKSLIAPPNQSEFQREQIMRHIASSKPTGDVTMLETLSELERDFGQNTSLIVITASLDGPWVDALGGLSRRGVRVSTVLMDRASYGGESNHGALEHLTNIGVSTYPLSRGDSISGALLNPIGGDRGILRSPAGSLHPDEIQEAPMNGQSEFERAGSEFSTNTEHPRAGEQ